MKKELNMTKVQDNRDELAEILKLMAMAVENAWKRNEAVTTQYLELAKTKAEILMEKI